MRNAIDAMPGAIAFQSSDSSRSSHHIVSATASPVKQNHLDPLDAFAALCELGAVRARRGEIDLLDAVDVVQLHAPPIHAHPTSEDRKVTRKRRRKTDTHARFAAFRVAELNRLFDHRYGPVLPDDDAGRDDVMIVLHHLARRQGKIDVPTLMTNWINCRAPWLTSIERDEFIGKAMTKAILYRADTLAERLRLTAVERAHLNIKTIGAIDMPLAQRQEARKAKKRKDQSARRRASGCKPRCEMGPSIEELKPWDDEGIKRRTWYRRRKTAHLSIGLNA